MAEQTDLAVRQGSWLKAAHPVSFPAENLELVIRGVRILKQDLVSPDGQVFPPRHYRRMLCLLNEYAAICHLAEVIFPIASGFRSPRWQSAYYSASHYLHCNSYALDIAPVNDWTIGQMSAIAHIRRRQEDSRLVGIGLYPRWLHIDVRPRQKGVTWIGTPSSLD